MIEDAPYREQTLENNLFRPPWMSWIGKVRLYAGSVSESGTANPTTNLWIGRRFYRTDINKPVWCSAVSGTWRDAAANVVA